METETRMTDELPFVAGSVVRQLSAQVLELMLQLAAAKKATADSERVCKQTLEQNLGLSKELQIEKRVVESRDKSWAECEQARLELSGRVGKLVIRMNGAEELVDRQAEDLKAAHTKNLELTTELAQAKIKLARLEALEQKVRAFHSILDPASPFWDGNSIPVPSLIRLVEAFEDSFSLETFSRRLKDRVEVESKKKGGKKK